MQVLMCLHCCYCRFIFLHINKLNSLVQNKMCTSSENCGLSGFQCKVYIKHSRYTITLHIEIFSHTILLPFVLVLHMVFSKPTMYMGKINKLKATSLTTFSLECAILFCLGSWHLQVMKSLLQGQVLQTCIWACLTPAVKPQEGVIHGGHF